MADVDALTDVRERMQFFGAEGADEQDKAINRVDCLRAAPTDRSELAGGSRAQDMIITFGIVIIYSLQKGDAGQD